MVLQWNVIVMMDGQVMIVHPKIVVVVRFCLFLFFVLCVVAGGGLILLTIVLCYFFLLSFFPFLPHLLLLPSSFENIPPTDNGCENGDCVYSAAGKKKVCVCEDGWRGVSCDLRVCDPPCGPYGDCGNDATCICDPSWEGALCDRPTCPHNCGGFKRGHCVSHHNGLSHTCACEVTYQSPYCLHQECPKNNEGHVCSARGVCQDGKCLCETGKSGRVCEISTCPSSPVDVEEDDVEKR